jgi:hypothetical protein
MKKAYIVHGWDGSPHEPLHEWLTEELSSRGYAVTAPEMPEPETPEIGAWVEKLAKVVEAPNEDTIFIGHSVGCQTILRYLESLPPGVVIGKVIFIAPWLTITGLEDDELAVAAPWVETNIDEAKVRLHAPSISAIFSDNDPFVPTENMGLFSERFHTKNILEHGKGHFTEDDGVTELKSALATLLHT